LIEELAMAHVHELGIGNESQEELERAENNLEDAIQKLGRAKKVSSVFGAAAALSLGAGVLFGYNAITTNLEKGKLRIETFAERECVAERAAVRHVRDSDPNKNIMIDLRTTNEELAECTIRTQQESRQDVKQAWGSFVTALIPSSLLGLGFLWASAGSDRRREGVFEAKARLENADTMLRLEEAGFHEPGIGGIVAGTDYDHDPS
jgi:hypothetical protein